MTDPFELTPREKAQIRTSSVERMINTTLSLVNRLRKSSDPNIAEDADTNWQDWKEHRTLVRKLWERERDTIFRRDYLKQEPKEPK